MAATMRQTTGFATALGVAAVVALFYLAQTPWTTLWDRDEPHFAQAAVEMVRSHDALVPTFNGEPRLTKPILIYWLMAATVRVLGATELAVRFWSPVGVAVAALFTFVVGRRLFSRSCGLLAMPILAASPLVMIEGLLATTDAVLLACVTGAIAAFVALAPGAPPRRLLRVVTMAAALALGLLAKGPVGLIVPLLAIAPVLWLGRWKQTEMARKLRVPTLAADVVIASVLGLLAFAAWAVPANAATGGGLVGEALGRQLLLRLVTPMEGHGGNFFLTLPAYIPVVLVGFAPWTLFLPGAIWALRHGALGDRDGRALLAAWIMGPLVLFSLVATKLPHYVLPIWPPLALAVAATIDAAHRGALPEGGRRWLKRGVWLFVPAVALEVAVLAAAAVGAPLPGVRLPAVLLAVAVIAAASLALRAHRRGAFRRAATILAPVTLATQAVLTIGVLPAVEALKPVPRLAAAIRARTAATVPVATAEFFEPSLVFYLGRTPVTRLGDDEAVVAWAHSAGDGVLVLPRFAIERIGRHAGAWPLTEIAAAEGINVAKGNRLELVALSRGAGR